MWAGGMVTMIAIIWLACGIILFGVILQALFDWVCGTLKRGDKSGE